MTARTFKTKEAAAKKLALALGMKGAAGGWIYRPRIDYLVLSGAGSVPAKWRGSHVYRSWAEFVRNYGGSLAETDAGRWYVCDAAARYEAAKAASSEVYAKMLAALARGDEVAAAEYRARHEGWKVRVFAAYDLAFGATVKVPVAA